MRYNTALARFRDNPDHLSQTILVINNSVFIFGIITCDTIITINIMIVVIYLFHSNT